MKFCSFGDSIILSIPKCDRHLQLEYIYAQTIEFELFNLGARAIGGFCRVRLGECDDGPGIDGH